MTELKENASEVIAADFKERKVLERLKLEPDGNVPKFLRDMANFSKKHKVKAAFVMTIEENDHVEWMPLLADEHSTAIMCLALEDARNELKAVVFNEDPEEA